MDECINEILHHLLHHFFLCVMSYTLASVTGFLHTDLVFYLSVLLLSHWLMIYLWLGIIIVFENVWLKHHQCFRFTDEIIV